MKLMHGVCFLPSKRYLVTTFYVYKLVMKYVTLQLYVTFLISSTHQRTAPVCIKLYTTYLISSASDYQSDVKTVVDSCL